MVLETTNPVQDWFRNKLGVGLGWVTIMVRVRVGVWNRVSVVSKTVALLRFVTRRPGK